TMGASLQWLFKSDDPELTQRALFHRYQTASAAAIEDMVAKLQRLNTAEDCFHLQEQLLGLVLEIEKTEHDATRRVRANSNDLEARAEQFAAGRAPRQLRVVGDGMAWMVTAGQRAAILALSQNDRPGRLHGKGKGLQAEVTAVNHYWREGHFA